MLSSTRRRLATPTITPVRHLSEVSHEWVDYDTLSANPHTQNARALSIRFWDDTDPLAQQLTRKQRDWFENLPFWRRNIMNALPVDTYQWFEQRAANTARNNCHERLPLDLEAVKQLPIKERLNKLADLRDAVMLEVILVQDAITSAVWDAYPELPYITITDALRVSEANGKKRRSRAAKQRGIALSAAGANNFKNNTTAP